MIFSLHRFQNIIFLALLVLPLFSFAQEYQIWEKGEKPISGMKPSLHSKLSFEMVQNEFELALINFPQITQKDSLSKIQNISLTWKNKSPEIKWNIYYLADHKISQSSFDQSIDGTYLDIVIPHERVSKVNFKIPSENIPLTPWLLIEFYNQSNSSAGDYEGQLNFEISSKKVTIPVTLKLHSYLLPQRLELKTSFGFAPWSVLKKHYGGWNKSEKELYEKYFELAQEHRIDLHKIYTSFPELDKDGKIDLSSPKNKTSFLDPWTELQKGHLSQYAFKASVTDLPVKEDMKTSITPKKIEFWKSLNQSVKKNELRDSTFVYFADEPNELKLIDLRNSLKKIKDEKVDLNFLLTHHYIHSLENLINWWCINYHQWDQKGYPSPEFYQQRISRNKSEQVWLYVSCNSHGCSGAENNYEPDFTFDRPSSYLRSLPWLATFYNVDGILYYDTVLGYDKSEMSPWKDEFNFTGWGEGNLFYPCNEKFCGEKDQYPLASLRLKIFRDGLEDAQIIKDSIKINPKNKEKLKSIIKGPRSFPLKIVEYNKLKFL
jgi:hypothetical protein